MWRSQTIVLCAVAALPLGAGCGNEGGRDGTIGGSGSATLTDSGTGAGPASTGGTAGVTGLGTGGGSGTGGSATGSSSASGSGPGTRFDLSVPDAGGDPCSGDGTIEFSYIWIASGDSGTVYKVDTFTGTIEGRYYTHPNVGSGSPSRTSVNLLGDVAVSNRDPGSVTKIAAIRDRCVDINGNGSIETSSGANDILPWGADECVLWHTDFPDAIPGKGARPTQWEAGTPTGTECEVALNPRLWIGYLATGDVGTFVRLDSATGQVLDRVDLPGVFSSHPHHRPYGGVVNADGDLWAVGFGKGTTSPLVHIDAETLTLTNYGNPIGDYYGLTIDADGNPWASHRHPVNPGGALYHFDAATETFTEVLTNTGDLRGSSADAQGYIWAAANNPCGLAKIDVQTKSQVGTLIDLPGCVTPVGVSIDIEGYVWVVDTGNGTTPGRAYKVDPGTHGIALTVDNLEQPYTYSDMTGAGLRLVSGPGI